MLEFEDLPAMLRGDNMRLKQVLINLVKNALKFTSHGSVRVLMAFDTAESMLHVHVVDTGKGIREDEICKLFSLFGKLQRTSHMNSEGIGMGLMICKGLVNMNGGEISVHSEGENQGSVFSFTMKMQLVVETEVHEETKEYHEMVKLLQASSADVAEYSSSRRQKKPPTLHSKTDPKKLIFSSIK